MSLINDMLRDLDKRKAPEQTVGRESNTIVTPVVPLKNNSAYRWLLWFILIAGISFLIAFLFKVYNTYDDRVQQAIVEKENAEAVLDVQPASEVEQSPAVIIAKAKPEKIALNKSVSIESITINELDLGARIEIKLSDVVDHRVQKGAEQELLIQLPNTELTELLPSMASHPLIDAIDVASDKENLQLKVSLAEEATFQTYLLNKGAHALLIIELLAQKVMPALTDEPSKDTLKPEEQTAILVDQNTPDILDESAKTPPSVFAKTTREKTLSEKDREASQQALSLYRSGNPEAAIAQLTKMVAQHPQANQSRETLVVMLIQQSRNEEAIKAVDTGLSVSPGSAALLKLKARLLMLKGQQKTALSLLSQHKGSHLNDLEYLSLLASLLQQQGEHTQAVNLYRDLLKQDSAQPQWWVGQAISLEAIGLTNDALQAYLHAKRIPGIGASLRQYADERIRALN